MGAEVSLGQLFSFPLLVIALWAIASSAKVLASFALFRKLLGNRYSMLLGLGLSIRFSTSLVVQYLLFTNGLISSGLYSALIATAILMKPLVIGTYSYELGKGKPP